MSQGNYGSILEYLNDIKDKYNTSQHVSGFPTLLKSITKNLQNIYCTAM